MSKESTYAMPCNGCGRSYAFLDYHLDHCPNTLANAPVEEPTRKRRRRRRRKNGSS